MPHNTNPSLASNADMIWVDPMSRLPKIGRQLCPGQDVLLTVNKRDRTWSKRTLLQLFSVQITNTDNHCFVIYMLVKVKSSRGFANPANGKKLKACLFRVGRCWNSHVNI